MEGSSEEEPAIEVPSAEIERGGTMAPAAPPDSEVPPEEPERSRSPGQQQPEDGAVEPAAVLQACDLQGPSARSDASDASDAGSDAPASGALFADQDIDESPPQPAYRQQQADMPSTLPRALAAALRGAPAPAPGQREGPASDADLLSGCPKHVLVFSNAGKPIYSYRGDEARLAGLTATAEAILSVAHSKGHALKHVRAGQHVFVFLERAPLCLVGVSALGEPPAVLRMQLVLVHGQIVSLLTASALSAMFARNPGYDARKLLGGSERLLSALVDSFSAVPAALLGAYPSLPLLGGVRQALATALAAAVKATSAVHGLLVAGGQVAAACVAPGVAPLQQWDVLLLLNLLAANPSFRHSGEAMTPVCLPRYNSAANLHAYIHYCHPATHTALVLLCGGMPDLATLAAARQRLQEQLEAVGALAALARSAAREAPPAWGGGGAERGGAGPGGRPGPLLAVPSLPAAAGGGIFGATPLLHVVYKHSGRQQYVMSPFSPPLEAAGLRQSLIVAYSQLRAAMYEGGGAGGGPLQRQRWEARPRFTLLGSVSGDTELFLALDPLTDAAEAAGVASRLGMWLAARHDQLFGL